MYLKITCKLFCQLLQGCLRCCQHVDKLKILVPAVGWDNKNMSPAKRVHRYSLWSPVNDSGAPQTGVLKYD